MKKRYAFFFALLFGLSIHSQTMCDNDFAYLPAGITFGAAVSTWGDSMLTIPVVNHSGQGFAYPQMKLQNVTALPPGMALNPNFNGWAPFASAWLDTDTAYFYCEYDVNQPIPANFMVTFRVWLRPNDITIGYDSCVFAQDFTYNLNPQTGIAEPVNTPAMLLISPNPSGGNIQLSPVSASQGIVIDLRGCNVLAFRVDAAGNADLSQLPAGIYFLFLYNEKGEPAGKAKLVKE